MTIAFTKLHGNGNDFILIDEMAGTVIPDDMKAQFAVSYCDRRFGIGGDGVLFISPSQTADVRMRLFQPDASEAEMCGNGIRCLAKYAFDNNYAKTKSFSVETLAGVLTVRAGYDAAGDFSATIDMGVPAYDAAAIPAVGSGDFSAEIAGMTVYAANTGVPHAVIFVEDVAAVDLDAVAPQIRHHALFPKGTNVNFVQVTGPSAITIRTFERGVEGETLSCGTGSTASALISAKIGKVSGDVVHVETVGGPLDIGVGDRATMTGPAETVFVGEIPF
ncbi:diaminopimelate epimerase [Methanocorpusculum vombati]|uniref:Diaminopimelate epimerase n=1 Tax=Methanocorpusculum vombati TaxID=3002864 RepID=A0ABT4IJQ5_9EURY|nr:diaminopimelate epimerase [Methanocorpusculum vombati]MCZ9313601.1 diaminopimelate epimerase [Methanocorpusculum sp.]MCZ0861952.1 diaminopimelate epimerase [Methanocorpusculum vombati]MCZ9320027.1 diaminopimelate epimerase [Methanocorpusculum sp.]MDE2520072.1 diaminopimelate epimerase [Methanocorpusculum sp.]MDE2535261.1 diaminopimelate epimerase [Methanocorpusculum sp.]